MVFSSLRNAKPQARNEADRLWASTPQNGGRIYGKACQFPNYAPSNRKELLKHEDFSLGWWTFR